MSWFTLSIVSLLLGDSIYCNKISIGVDQTTSGTLNDILPN